MQQELKKARASLYSMFASLYVSGGIEKDTSVIKLILQTITENPFTGEAQDSAHAMLDMLNNDLDGVKKEFEDLFNLPFGDFINSSASFYKEQREFTELTIVAKEIMKEARYVKDDSLSGGEDEFGVLFALCARLLEEDKDTLFKRVFFEIVEPHIQSFIDAQLSSYRADFYKYAAVLSAVFIAFEKSYFETYEN